MNYDKTKHQALGTNEQLKSLISEQWESFKQIHGRYPTTQEIDTSNMVSSKTIQRRFGSVANLRKLLGCNVINYSAGNERSKTSAISMKRSLTEEMALSSFLVDLFGEKPNVIIEERYMGHSRHRSDCGIYHNGKHFFVDIFSAKDKYSLAGCINFKQKKLVGVDEDVFLVSSNPDISQEFIDELVYKKKNPLDPRTKVLTLENFKKLCTTMKSML